MSESAKRKFSKYVPPIETWPAIAIIGGLGAAVVMAAIPKIFAKVMANTPNLQKDAPAAPVAK